MLDAGVAEAVDDLLGLLGRRDSSSDAESLDRESFLLHLLPKRELESPARAHRISYPFPQPKARNEKRTTASG